MHYSSLTRRVWQQYGWSEGECNDRCLTISPYCFPSDNAAMRQPYNGIDVTPWLPHRQRYVIVAAAMRRIITAAAMRQPYNGIDVTPWLPQCDSPTTETENISQFVCVEIRIFMYISSQIITNKIVTKKLVAWKTLSDSGQ